MRRLIRVALVAAMILTNRLALAEGQQYAASVAITSSNTSVTFGFTASQVLLINDGPNKVYVDFADTEADLSGFEVRPGESISVSATSSTPGRSGIGVVCAVGENSTVRVLALQ
jgi:hypothetical protein